MCDGDGRQCGHYTNDLRIFVEYIYVILWTTRVIGNRQNTQENMTK